MNSLVVSTNSFKPNTKLTKKQISELDNKLDESELNREIILEVATILCDNTLAPLTENELNRMIYMLKEKKGSLREIKSIIMRAIMMAIPSSNGGKRIRGIKRKTIKQNKKYRHLRHTKKK